MNELLEAMAVSCVHMEMNRFFEGLYFVTASPTSLVLAPKSSRGTDKLHDWISCPLSQDSDHMVWGLRERFPNGYGVIDRIRKHVHESENGFAEWEIPHFSPDHRTELLMLLAVPQYRNSVEALHQIILSYRLPSTLAGCRLLAGRGELQKFATIDAQARELI